uniref:Uncharacterized protein n=1 Tax=Glossina palpalis gambiensis TaxID=67801 RepID=A0A1B0B4G2_9MUSC
MVKFNNKMYLLKIYQKTNNIDNNFQKYLLISLILIEFVYCELDHNFDRHLRLPSPHYPNYDEELIDDPYKDYLPQANTRTHLPPLRLTLPAEDNYLMNFAEPINTYTKSETPIDEYLHNGQAPSFDGYRYKTIRRRIYRNL